MKKIYLDYAATTPVDPRVLKAMLPYFNQKFGNPSSVHSWGQETREAIENAREQVARVLNCAPREIYFTGTTTTSDNLAIQGVVWANWEQLCRRTGSGQPNLRKRLSLITTQVEHHAVLDTCLVMEKRGFDLTILPVDKDGLVGLKDLEKAIQPETVLVTIMSANNEVGTVQPIREISKLIKSISPRPSALSPQPVYFHTDAAAVADYLDLDTKKLGVDLMTIGAHKFGGPKGIGVLYVRSGVEIEPVTFGGHHERRLWPGTESVPLIVGLAKALEISQGEREQAVQKVIKLRDRLIEGVLTKISDSHLTGHPVQRLPDIASFVFPGAEGEAILLMLDEKGIAASSGSACTSGILKPSHVLTAMGIPPEIAHSSIRFSLGKQTTEKEIDYVLAVLPVIIKRLRKMAPKLATSN